MKRATMILGAAILITSTCFAQRTFKPGIGVNWTDFSEKASGDAKSEVGWQIGGSIAFQKKKFYWEPGVFYVGKATGYSGDSVTGDFDAKINGIRIPIAIGLSVIGDVKSGVALRVFGGPSVFFVTSVGGMNKDNVETFHFGLFAGAGIDFWKLFLDASYEWGMTNTQKDNATPDLGKPRSLFLTAGLRF